MTHLSKIPFAMAIALSTALAAGCDAGTEDGTGGAASDAASGGNSSGGSSSGGSSSGGSSSGGAIGLGGNGTGGTGEDCDTILEIATAGEDFSILVEAVTKAGLADALAGDDLTVFAPTNDAFVALLDALGLESLDDLNADQLAPILTYHVVDGVVDAAAATAVAEGDGEAATLGGTVRLSVDGTDLVIDAEEFSATVITADVAACNGIIHVIDGVVVPSILDIVATSGQFSELAGLVGAAESGAAIAGVLDGPANAIDDMLDPGGFTLFAPSNEAIMGLASAPSAEALDDILQYHVYAADSAVDAATALSLDMADIEMVSGDTLTVDGGDSVTLTDTGESDSTVILANVYAANGIIHQIDGVLLPLSITDPS